MALMRGSFESVTFNIPAAAALGHLVFCGIAAYSCYLYIMKEMPAAKAGTYAYVNPAIAIVLGFLILGEKINVQIILSMTIILLGVYMVQGSGLKAAQKEELPQRHKAAQREKIV